MRNSRAWQEQILLAIEKYLPIFLCLCLACPSLAATPPDDQLDFYCLRLSWPQVEKMERDGQGRVWLKLKNGARTLYSGKQKELSPLIGDVAASMRQIYPLEPDRPETPRGVSPGRQRPYEFFEILHGKDRKEVSANLRPVQLPGKSIKLVRQAAQALQSAGPELQTLAEKRPELRKLLKPEGGFYWRDIAGENVLSAHSYGVALDMGADSAPYWRWSRKMPHPMQKSYPAEIVRIFEKRGFIWGGKWHEYDLMHFEYRPELICKSRMLKFRNKPFSEPLKITPRKNSR